MDERRVDKKAVQYPPILGDVPIGFDPQWEQKYKAWVNRRRRFIQQVIAEAKAELQQLEASSGQSIDWAEVEKSIRPHLEELERQHQRVYSELRRLMDTAVGQGRRQPLKPNELENYFRGVEERLAQEMREADRKREEEERKRREEAKKEFRRQLEEYQRMQRTRNFFEGAKDIYRRLSQNMVPEPFRQANRFVAERTLQMIPAPIRQPIAEFQKELRRYPLYREVESGFKRILGID